MRLSLGTAGLAHHAVLAHRSVDRHMRLDPARLQPFDEGLHVIVFLSAPRVAPLGSRSLKVAAASRSAVPVRQRRVGRHDQAVAVLHQRVAEIGETAFLSLGFPEQTRITCPVVEACVASSTASSCGNPSLHCGRTAASPNHLWAENLFIDAHALSKVPVDREMLGAQKPHHFRQGDERGQKLLARSPG